MPGRENHPNLKLSPASANTNRNIIPLAKSTIFCSSCSSLAFNLLLKSEGDFINTIIPTMNIGIKSRHINSHPFG